MRRFDHIDLRVPDLEAVREFYIRLLPVLGFTQDMEIPDWISFASEPLDGQTATEFFGVTGDASHVANGSRIAFWAGSREEIDAIGVVLHRIGARNIEGPEVYEDPWYYAVFFEDPAGNKFEVAYREKN
jgi:catechol 2,3-dioxygenase-like lactoylglutathione lyase family enzyme